MIGKVWRRIKRTFQFQKRKVIPVVSVIKYRKAPEDLFGFCILGKEIVIQKHNVISMFSYYVPEDDDLRTLVRSFHRITREIEDPIGYDQDRRLGAALEIVVNSGASLKSNLETLKKSLIRVSRTGQEIKKKFDSRDS